MRIISTIIICLLLTSCSYNQQKMFYSAPNSPPPPPAIENVNIALVLGGGGARGLAHVGVLEVLEENNIPIDLIVGSSAGSAVGALYADHQNAKLLHSQLMNLRAWDILQPSLLGFFRSFIDIQGAVDGFSYQKFLNDRLIAKDIENLKIPLVVVTTDIERNEAYLIRSGPIVPAVHASSAIPPIFSPVSLYGHTLVDGGVIEPVPVDVARQFNPKMVVCVDISNMPLYGIPRNMFYITYKSIWLYYAELSRIKSMSADITIHPRLEGFEIFDDKNSHDLVDLGRRAARKALYGIKQRMRELKIAPKEPKHG